MTCPHDVFFYDTRTALHQRVTGYVNAAVRDDHTMIVIACTDALTALTTGLESAPMPFDALRRAGRLIVVDAGATLASISGPYGLDIATVSDVAERLITEAFAGGRPVRLYGEMVALLWQDGHIGQAMELERFWDDLASERGFELLCAYPSHLLTTVDHPAESDRIQTLHRRVLDETTLTPLLHSRTYACESASIPLARHDGCQSLQPYIDDTDTFDIVALIVSELAANAIEHARSPFTLQLGIETASLLITVHDADRHAPVLQPPDMTRTRGRGIAIIDALAHSRGTDPTSSGKRVWARIALPA